MMTLWEALWGFFGVPIVILLLFNACEGASLTQQAGNDSWQDRLPYRSGVGRQRVRYHSLTSRRTPDDGLQPPIPRQPE